MFHNTLGESGECRLRIPSDPSMSLTKADYYNIVNSGNKWRSHTPYQVIFSCHSWPYLDFTSKVITWRFILPRRGHHAIHQHDNHEGFVIGWVAGWLRWGGGIHHVIMIIIITTSWWSDGKGTITMRHLSPILEGHHGRGNCRCSWNPKERKFTGFCAAGTWTSTITMRHLSLARGPGDAENRWIHMFGRFC